MMGPTAIAAGLIVLFVSAPVEAGTLTIEVLPHTLTGKQALVDVKGNTVFDNHLILSEKRGELKWDIPAFDESLHGQLLSVGLEFSYANVDLNYHAGVNEAVDSSIAGELLVLEVLRLNNVLAGLFLNDVIDSTAIPIGPFGTGIDPGLTCQIVNDRCLYPQETKLTSAAAYFFDQSSAGLVGFTNTVFASLIFEMNLSWVTDSTDYRIASSIGLAEPLPAVPLRVTYTYADSAPVPEPASLMLVGIGASGWLTRTIAGRRRRS